MDSHLSAELPDIQSTKKKRKPNWSPEETLLLVNIIADKHLIINGRFKPHLTNKDKKDAWHAVANTINGQNPLVSRTVEEVETKWFSVLSKSRKKIASIKAEYNQTGEMHFHKCPSWNIQYMNYSNPLHAQCSCVPILMIQNLY